mgnify:CR=1 FL=1
MAPLASVAAAAKSSPAPAPQALRDALREGHRKVAAALHRRGASLGDQGSGDASEQRFVARSSVQPEP